MERRECVGRRDAEMQRGRVETGCKRRINKNRKVSAFFRRTLVWKGGFRFQAFFKNSTEKLSQKLMLKTNKQLETEENF